MTKQYTELMLDIETLATRTDAVVLSVAGVAFDLHEDQLEEMKQDGDVSMSNLLSKLPHFNFNLVETCDEQKENGRYIDPGTVDWWGRQPKEAQDAILKNSHMLDGTDKPYDVITSGHTDVKFSSIESFFKAYFSFINMHGIKYAWGNGAVFDNAILIHMYESHPTKLPWHPISFRNNDDYRTAIRIAQIKSDYSWPETPDGFINHNAIHDAARQVTSLQKAMAMI